MRRMPRWWAARLELQKHEQGQLLSPYSGAGAIEISMPNGARIGVDIFVNRCWSDPVNGEYRLTPPPCPKPARQESPVTAALSPASHQLCVLAGRRVIRGRCGETG
jgi:hypothetical protein